MEVLEDHLENFPSTHILKYLKRPTNVLLYSKSAKWDYTKGTRMCEHEKCIIYDDKENVRSRHAGENDMTQIIDIKR